MKNNKQKGGVDKIFRLRIFLSILNKILNMDWQISLYYIIPAVFIILLVFPVFFEVRISFNPMYNRGVIAIFVFKINILYFIVSFHGKYIELQNKKETKRQALEFSSPQFALIEEFGRQIKDKIRLKKCLVFYNIGTGDAFQSAMICGLLNQIFTYICLFVKSKKPTASFCIYDTVSYNKPQSEIAGRVALSISFFDVVYSFILSLILTKKQNTQ